MKHYTLLFILVVVDLWDRWLRRIVFGLDCPMRLFGLGHSLLLEFAACSLVARCGALGHCHVLGRGLCRRQGRALDGLHLDDGLLRRGFCTTVDIDVAANGVLRAIGAELIFQAHSAARTSSRGR